MKNARIKFQDIPYEHFHPQSAFYILKGTSTRFYMKPASSVVQCSVLSKVRVSYSFGNQVITIMKVNRTYNTFFYSIGWSCHYIKYLCYYIRCLTHYTRCLFHYTRCLFLYMRCCIHYIRCFPGYIQCLFHYIRCPFYYIRCFLRYIRF